MFLWGWQVHCRRGVSRSAAVVAAYLVASERMRLVDAMSLLRARHARAMPNNGFMRSLIALERSVHNSTSLSVDGEHGVLVCVCSTSLSVDGEHGVLVCVWR